MLLDRTILMAPIPTKWGVVPLEPTSEMTSLKDPIVRVHMQLRLSAESFHQPLGVDGRLKTPV